MLGDKSIPSYIRDENKDGKIDLDDYYLYKAREDRREEEKRKKSEYWSNKHEFDDCPDIDDIDIYDIDLDDLELDDLYDDDPDFNIEKYINKADAPNDLNDGEDGDDDSFDDDTFDDELIDDEDDDLDEEDDFDTDCYDEEDEPYDECSEYEISINISVEDTAYDGDGDKHDDLDIVPKKKKKTYSKSGQVNRDLIESRKKYALKYLENTISKTRAEKERLRFIVAGKETAACYLTNDGYFLYAQAIKDHFVLPFDVEDEEFESETELDVLIDDIASIDPKYAVEIWDWCLATFYPHRKYLYNQSYQTDDMFLNLYDMSDEVIDEIAEHMENDPTFIERVVKHCPIYPSDVKSVIHSCLVKGYGSTARRIVQLAFAHNKVDVHKKMELISGVVNLLCWDDEVEGIELFKDEVFPIVYGQTDVRIKVKIKEWEKDISEHIDSTLRYSDKYAYSRINAWRKKYISDRECEDVDPVDYRTEEEYLEAVKKQKYRWRRSCQWGPNCKVDPDDYETEDEYNQAFEEARAEAYRLEKAERERRMKEEGEENEERNKLALEQKRQKTELLLSGKDKVISFCKVFIDGDMASPLYYLTGNGGIALGDRVTVPYGSKNELRCGTVVSIGECFASALHFPADKIKAVIGKE